MSEIEIIGPGEQISIDPTSAGFAHGYGIFETIRCADGRLYFWEAHWQRMLKAMKAMGIAADFEQDSVLDGIRRLVAQCGDGAQTIKLSVLNEANRSRLLIYVRPAFPAPEGCGFLVGDAYRLDETSLLAGFKTHNYMENMMLMSRARAEGCYDLLRLDSLGYIAEGAVANVFWVKEGQLYTPSEETGLLPGVVREALIDGLDVEVGRFPLEDLLSADAVFLTNSSIGALQVEWFRVDGVKIPAESGGSGWQEKLTSVVEAAGKLDSVSL